MVTLMLAASLALLSSNTLVVRIDSHRSDIQRSLNSRFLARPCSCRYSAEPAPSLARWNLLFARAPPTPGVKFKAPDRNSPPRVLGTLQTHIESDDNFMGHAQTSDTRTSIPTCY